RRRIDLTTVGSLGDLHPYVAIALGLQARGHEAILATANYSICSTIRRTPSGRWRWGSRYGKRTACGPLVTPWKGYSRRLALAGWLGREDSSGMDQPGEVD